MHLILQPNLGANDLTFGESREKIRALLRHSPLRTMSSEPENDFYPQEGLILGYDATGRLEFIEVIRPSTAEFGDIQLFDMELPRVIAALHARGLTAPFQRGCYNFKEPGLSLYCPSQKLESVSIYRKGYYDKA